uniref:Uncharacterized protein n=1 Tax=viral metagenome TaxID=1070528 RepID=A0A6M3JF71_9ZZZZ
MEPETYLGKEVIRSTAPFRIFRKTSQYNKYMKWNLVFYYEDNDTVLSSQWFKTEHEAVECVERMKRREPFPIGQKYQILTPVNLSA